MINLKYSFFVPVPKDCGIFRPDMRSNIILFCVSVPPLFTWYLLQLPETENAIPDNVTDATSRLPQCKNQVHREQRRSGCTVAMLASYSFLSRHLDISNKQITSRTAQQDNSRLVSSFHASVWASLGVPMYIVRCSKIPWLKTVLSYSTTSFSGATHT